MKKLILFLIGLSPFMFSIINGIRDSVIGFGLDGSSGLSGFLSSVGFNSVFLWPLYIAGILLILKAIKVSTKIIIRIIVFIFIIIAISLFALSIMNVINIADISNQIAQYQI